jgi:hypothetical protein
VFGMHNDMGDGRWGTRTAQALHPAAFRVLMEGLRARNEKASAWDAQTLDRVATRRAAHWGARRSGLLIHPVIPRSGGADCRRPIIFSSVIRFAGQSDRAAVCVRSRGTSAIPSCDSERAAWYVFPGPLLCAVGRV